MHHWVLISRVYLKPAAIEWCEWMLLLNVHILVHHGFFSQSRVEIHHLSFEPSIQYWIWWEKWLFKKCVVFFYNISLSIHEKRSHIHKNLFDVLFCRFQSNIVYILCWRNFNIFTLHLVPTYFYFLDMIDMVFYISLQEYVIDYASRTRSRISHSKGKECIMTSFPIYNPLAKGFILN